MKSKFFFLPLSALVAVILLPTADALAQSKKTNAVVAVVNSEIITQYDVALFANRGEVEIRNRYTPEDLRDADVRKEMQAEINDWFDQAANLLVDQHLIFGEFSKNGRSVPDEMIDKRFDEFISSPPFNGNIRKFEDYLAEQETSVEDFRETLAKRIAVRVMTSREVDRRILVTPQQVQQYYMENKDKLARPERIRLGMLEVKHALHKNHAERVEAIEAGIAAGTDFADLVRDASDGPKKSDGGDLGWQDLATMRLEFRKALGTFSVGTVSPAIPLSGSTYFLKVLEADKVQQADFETMRPQLEQRLRANERSRLYKKWVDGLEQKAYVRRMWNGADGRR